MSLSIVANASFLRGGPNDTQQPNFDFLAAIIRVVVLYVTGDFLAL